MMSVMTDYDLTMLKKCIICYEFRPKPAAKLHSLSEENAKNFVDIYEMLIFCVPQMKPALDKTNMICKMCLYELRNCVSFIEKCIRASKNIIRDQIIQKACFMPVSPMVSDIKTEVIVLDVETRNNCPNNIEITYDNAAKFTDNNGVGPEILNKTEIEETFEIKDDPDTDIVKFAEELSDNYNEPTFIDVASTSLINGHSEHNYSADINSVETKDAIITLPKSQTSSSSEQPVRHKCALYKCKRVHCNECNELHCELRKHTCQFECRRCEYTFTRKKDLEIHIEDNKDEEECKIACPHCPLILSLNEIEQHIKRHDTFQCTVCSKAFNSNGALRTHLHVHKEKDIQCSECGSCFTTKGSLRHHIIYRHKKIKPILCDQCPRTFYFNGALLRHKSSKHDRTIISMCPDCGQTFLSKTAADDHYRVIHLNQRRFCCEVCGRLFGRKDNMLKHTEICKLRNDKTTQKPKILQSDHPVECVYCNKILKSIKYLITHVKAMHLKAPRPFKCATCNLQFSAKISLTNHERIHKDPECKFRCDVCYKKFKDADDLGMHMLLKHKKTPYECDECGEKFARQFLMDNHKYSVHDSKQTFEAISQQKIDTAIKHAELKGNMEFHYKDRSEKKLKPTDTSEDNESVESSDNVNIGNV